MTFATFKSIWWKRALVYAALCIPLIALIMAFGVMLRSTDFPAIKHSKSQMPQNSLEQVAGIQTIVSPTVFIPVLPSTSFPQSTDTTPSFKALPENRHPATLIHVIDGDTLELAIGGNRELIRVIGIDTPETVDPRKPVECFGKEAADMARTLIQENEMVYLESDITQGDRDKYGRLLRFVWIAGGLLDYGSDMIARGYATEYTYRVPYKYQEVYRIKELEARAAKQGFWAEESCVGDPKRTQTDPSSTDMDCSDFATQAEAQAYFDSMGGSQANNVDRLDGSDRDGVVCESLP